MSISLALAAGMVAALALLRAAPLEAQEKPSAKPGTQGEKPLQDEIAKLKAQVKQLQATVEKCQTEGCPAAAGSGGAKMKEGMGQGGMQQGKMMEHQMSGGMEHPMGSGMQGGPMEHPMAGQSGGMSGTPSPGPNPHSGAAGDQGQPAMQRHMDDMQKHMDQMQGGGMNMPAPTAPPAAPSGSSGGMGGGMNDM